MIFNCKISESFLKLDNTDLILMSAQRSFSNYRIEENGAGVVKAN